jgi:hypothetical protein
MRQANGGAQELIMPHGYREAIRRHLWPREGGRDVWAILDGARHDRVYSYMIDSYLDSSCLYSGQLPPELEVAAPYLVNLEQDDALTGRLIDDGWGESWGVFLKTATSMPRLRRHLREFLVVRDPGGRRLVFRFYDPRVLRVYLPTCTTEELRMVFGPIEAFWMEGPEPSMLLEFLFDGRKLTQNSIALAPAEEARPA